MKIMSMMFDMLLSTSASDGIASS